MMLRRVKFVSVAPLCMVAIFFHPLVFFYYYSVCFCAWPVAGVNPHAAICLRRCVGVSLLQSGSARAIGIIIIIAAALFVVALRIWHPQRKSCHVASIQSQLHPRGKPQACRDVPCEAISSSDATKDGRTGDCGGVGSRKESNASLPGNCRHRPCDPCLVEVRCLSTFFFDER
ncbi:unspecified product [Trypanosoma cruzi Dm28c]|uniref:Unspecified product n=1 Tax=Trypanosoma cruzi Dm28c TaxID=1416333 RepID=V5B5C7_TRYCR|nr:unspecified product [Trypanosoma cruzi Dm28c]